MKISVPGKSVPIALLPIVAPPVALLAVVMAWTAAVGNGVDDVFRDPLAVPGVSGHAGIISSIGLLVWSATAACCALTAAVLRRQGRRPRDVAYLRAAALLTAALAVDDAFMLHERVFPVMIGIPQVLVMLAWAAAAGLFGLRFRRDLLAVERLAGVALFALMFAISYGIDGLQGAGLAPETTAVAIIEDSAKFIGICAWFAHHWKVGLAALVRAEAQRPSVAPQVPVPALRRTA